MIRRHLTYANVMSTLSMFLLLGGTAYAAATIGTADIKPAAVTAPKLADSAVTKPKVARDAITSAKVVNGSIRLVDINATDRRKLQGGQVALRVANTSINEVEGQEVVASGSYRTLPGEFSWILLRFHVQAEGCVGAEGAEYDLLVDGVQVVSDGTLDPGAAVGNGLVLDPTYLWSEPSAAATRTVQVRVEEFCTGSITFDEVQVRVIRAL